MRSTEEPNATNPTIEAGKSAARTIFPVLIGISASHLINDSLQSLIPATYPLVKASLHLSYAQIGLITFMFQITASLFQPLVGTFTDRRPQPFSLAIGMCFTCIGLVLLSRANSFHAVLVAVALVGTGSSIFHPESSRVAYMASGGRRGLAQSIFQVGGNTGSSLGPLLAALIISTKGQSEIMWFTLGALAGIAILANVGVWYRRNLHRTRPARGGTASHGHPELPRRTIALAVAILLLLIFSKFFYLASLTSYYTFYLITKFHVSVVSSQIYLFVFLFAVAAGTIIGGPVGDRIGRKYVIWASILGVAPFTLVLPWVGLTLTCILSVVIGIILASAMPAILVYAQELLPGNLGMISGLFFGFAFGMGGIGSALLGILADHTSIGFVYHLCAFLPLIGLLTAFLPNIEGHGRARAATAPAPAR